MITLFYWPTANNHKITIMLEETGISYCLQSVDITKGAQFSAEFLQINPNNRVPAIRDEPVGGQEICIFESGAILQYLSEKSGRFLPSDTKARFDVLQWLYWQVGGLGPMAGQNHHFSEYAETKIPVAIERYINETNRLYGVLERSLAGKSYIAGAYSIADMACYPWIALHERQRQDLRKFSNLERWFEQVGSRVAVQRAYEVAQTFRQRQKLEESPSSPTPIAGGPMTLTVQLAQDK